MQIKSFTAWVNLHLNKVGLEIGAVQTEFNTGILLLKLIEVISEEPMGKYIKNPVRCARCSCALRQTWRHASPQR